MADAFIDIRELDANTLRDIPCLHPAKDARANSRTIDRIYRRKVERVKPMK